MVQATAAVTNTGWRSEDMAAASNITRSRCLSAVPRRGIWLCLIIPADTGERMWGADEDHLDKVGAFAPR